jgi:histidine triad (HIT) family protein
LFCTILAGGAPAHFVLDEPDVAAFLDVRPLFPGHVLVLPREHHETLADLPARLLGPLMTQVRRISAAMPAAYGAQGSFVAINNKVSQSVPHLHVHVVPRTKGDGLRGFFWPRGRYADDAEAERYARRMRETLAAQPDSPDRSQHEAPGDRGLRHRAEHVAGDPAEAADGDPGQPQ